MLTAADDFTFFGSDAAEVVKSRPNRNSSRRTQWEQQRRHDTCPRPFGKIHRAIIGAPKTGWNTVVQRVDAAKVPLRSLAVFKAKLVIIQSLFVRCAVQRKIAVVEE